MELVEMKIIIHKFNQDLNISSASTNFNSSKISARFSIDASSTSSAQISRDVLHCSNCVGFP